ncbi:MAG: agmatinase [bacterium]|nr:MAG: agmatinase [bacterium]
MTQADTLRFLGAGSRDGHPDVVLFGVPFDATASFRPGARFGPAAIRIWSDVLETYSPAFDADLEDVHLVDSGDLQIPVTGFEQLSGEVRRKVKEVLRSGGRPLMMGGEHLVTLPAVEECLEMYADLKVLQLDAHLDRREEYQGVIFSHATVMKRIRDRLGKGRLLQFGVRSGTREEWEEAREEGAVVHDPGRLRASLGEGPVYLSVDLDVLDPSVMPETGTPEPGGLTFEQLQEVLLSLRGMNIIGADVVEYCPPPAGGGPSGAVAAKVVREMVLLMAEGPKGTKYREPGTRG